VAGLRDLGLSCEQVAAPFPLALKRALRATLLCARTLRLRAWGWIVVIAVGSSALLSSLRVPVRPVVGACDADRLLADGRSSLSPVRRFSAECWALGPLVRPGVLGLPYPQAVPCLAVLSKIPSPSMRGGPRMARGDPEASKSAPGATLYVALKAPFALLACYT
jgi:hypothetical protein